MTSSKEIKVPFDRRRFLRLIPPTVLASITNKSSFELLNEIRSQNNTTPNHNGSSIMDEEPQSLLIDPEMEIFLEEYIHNHQTKIEDQKESNNEIYWERELESLIRIQEFKISKAIPFTEINPQILNLYLKGFILDFTSLPEIKEANLNPNLQERFIKIIKLLAVQSKEELQFNLKILKEYSNPRRMEILKKVRSIDKIVSIYFSHNTDSNFENNPQGYSGRFSPEFLREWKITFPNKQPPSLEQLLALQEYYYNQLAKLEGWQFEEEIPVIQTWDNQASCNLYASSFMACLGLQNKCSHRVDSENNPIIYVLDPKTGRTKLMIEKEGSMMEPIGNIKELSAADQHQWFQKYSEKHGWVDVTNLSYEKKVELLKDGYVFYGSSEGHNWIILGLELDSKFQPVLTQATYNNFFSCFIPEEYLGKKINSFLYSELETKYAEIYKLMPQLDHETNAKLFAIKIK
jgi:hypothetical protein